MINISTTSAREDSIRYRPWLLEESKEVIKPSEMISP